MELTTVLVQTHRMSLVNLLVKYLGHHHTTEGLREGINLQKSFDCRWLIELWFAKEMEQQMKTALTGNEL